MRMSCNGCRVLRKGCSDDCSIRPCLQWIKSPESQANATLFLAKFYGRAGLMNLINSGPENLRPAIFRSLLYEACGRIVNPIYGSVGLLYSGRWELCQAAVEAVLKGAPVTPITSEAADANGHAPPFTAYDIRHISKDDNSPAKAGPRRAKIRRRHKRVPKPEEGGSDCKPVSIDDPTAQDEPVKSCEEGLNRTLSHESSLSHQSELAAPPEADGDSKETDIMVSGDTAEEPRNSGAEPREAAEPPVQDERNEVELDLTLGLSYRTEPVPRVMHVVPVKKRRFDHDFGRSLVRHEIQA